MANTLVEPKQEFFFRVIKLAIKMSDLSDKAKAVARLTYEIEHESVPQFEAKLHIVQDRVESLERTLDEMLHLE